MEPLSAAAVLALLDATTPRYRVAVALGVGLGLREGEAFGPDRSPVDCLPKGTRFHDLRHFYASTLIAANLNP